MKLQKEVAFASEKLNALIERKGLATIKTYMANVYNSHEWQNYEVRIANDVVKYAAIGRELSGLLDRNPDANDDHITTLCISVMKSAGLLPFNPDEVPDEKPADKKAALLEKAEAVPALTDELTRDELKAAADLLQDVADELAAIGYHSDALHVRSSLDYYRHAYMKKLHELTPEDVAEFMNDNGDKYAETVRHYIGEYLKAGDFCRALLYVVENYNGEAPAFVVKCSDYLFNKYQLCTLHHVKVEKATISTPTTDRVARYTADSLAVLTRNELARLKAALNSEWEKLHAAGLYTEAKRTSEQTGRISDEQARRRSLRDVSIPQPVAVKFEDGKTWPAVVFGFAVEDKYLGGFQCDDFNYFATEAEAVNYCRDNFPRTAFHVHVISREDALNETDGAALRTVYERRRVGRRLEVKKYPYTLTNVNESEAVAEVRDESEAVAFALWIILHNGEEDIYKTYPTREKAEEVAEKVNGCPDLFGVGTRFEVRPVFKSDEAEKCPTTGEKSEDVAQVAPTTGKPATSPTTGEGEAVGDFCPLTGQYLTNDGEALTPEEIKKIAHAQREKIKREKAEKVATARPEVLADLYGTTDRAEVLAKFADVTPDKAAELLAACYSPSEKLSDSTTLETAGEIKAHTSDELDNVTDPAAVPDWTRHAYEVAEMKRTGCTFGEARRRVQEVRARIMARKADQERENVGRIERKAANGHELTNDEREAVKAYHKKHGGRIPEAVAACALFLLSLNFGTGKPATMYTDDPETVAETIKANAPEVVAEWHEVPTPDGLPPYDVPALIL